MDPVPILQQEIDISMTKLRKNLANRDDILADKRGGNVDNFNMLGIQMMNDTRYLRTSLADISESIETVKKHMEDYNISEATLIQREQYVKHNLEEITKIEESIQAQNNRISTMKKSQAYAGPQTFSNSGNQQTLEQLVRQDQLEELYSSVSSQKVIANQIKSELDDQKILIDQLDDDVTNAEEAMKKVTKEIKKLLEIEGKTPTLLVFVLSIIFIILLFIVV